MVESKHDHRGAEAGFVSGNVGEIDQRKLGHAPLELSEARVDKVLALLRHVILGVLREIAHGHGLLDLGGKLVGELVLKKLDLFEKLFFNVLGHPWSVAGSGAAPSAGDERTFFLNFIIRGGGQAPGSGLIPQAQLSAANRQETAVTMLSGTLLVEKRLQNERGGDLVDHAAVLLAGVAGFIQNLVGFAGGQTLVPQVDGQAGQFAELGGKGLGFGGLRAGFA